MPFPQKIHRPPISRLLILTLTLFLVSAPTVSIAASSSFGGHSWRHRALAASPSSLVFGNVQVGSAGTQYQTLTNYGTSTVTISQATVTGVGFGLSGLNLPVSLSQGESVTFNVTFNPEAGGDASGAISMVSNAVNPNLAVGLSGTGVSAGRLTSSAGALDFGSVAVGASKVMTATLTATGSSVTIMSAATTSPEFRLSGLSLPATIAAGQSAPVSLTFTPQSSGAASGNISLASDAANTPVVETLSGSGTAATASHVVTLRWNPSISPVAGYNVYRSATPGGPYERVNPSVAAGTNYQDSSVQSGMTYYYVGTAVSAGGIESPYSSPSQATIPSP
ncbi:MAG: choice-of-anchor D domain-containing protein [Terriglobales bacterium]|jgi:Abnormal spindle-like microcephaly-assoc'd, ASPM-SPD-2-Hydin/HYDIN/CFA65/VesB-like, Ig-like domain